MSETPATHTARQLIMPEDVRAIQVVSLVEEIGTLGSGMTFTRLAEKTGVDVDVLPQILKTAEMLGLVRNEGGYLSLTEEGLGFQGSSIERISTLKATLASIEPFRTAVELTSKNGSTTSRGGGRGPCGPGNTVAPQPREERDGDQEPDDNLGDKGWPP